MGAADDIRRGGIETAALRLHIGPCFGCGLHQAITDRLGNRLALIGVGGFDRHVILNLVVDDQTYLKRPSSKRK